MNEEIKCKWCKPKQGQSVKEQESKMLRTFIYAGKGKITI